MMTKKLALAALLSFTAALPAAAQLAQNDELRARLRAGERMLAMLGHSQTLVCDWEGRVEAWTRGMERLFGHAPAEAVGAPARELLHSEFPLPWPEVVAALRRDGRWQGEVRHRHKDGSDRFAQETWGVAPSNTHLTRPGPGAVADLPDDVDPADDELLVEEGT